MSADGLTQRAAARLLGVSPSFLRASSCPRLEIPGNGPARRPLVRYFREDVLAWARRVAAHEPPHSASPDAQGPVGSPEKSAGKSGHGEDA